MIYVCVYMNCTGDDAVIQTHKPDVELLVMCVYVCINVEMRNK